MSTGVQWGAESTHARAEYWYYGEDTMNTGITVDPKEALRIIEQRMQVTNMLNRETSRIFRQSIKLDMQEGQRTVPGGFVCSTRLGKVER